MGWCNCYAEDVSNINEYSAQDNNGFVTCNICGQRINNESLILLLIKEVKRLSICVQDLLYYQEERDRIKEEERKQEEKAMEKLRSESERFNILDL